MRSTYKITLTNTTLLLTAVVCSLMPPVNADETTTTTTTGVGKYNVPISTTTTRETIMDPTPVQKTTETDTVYTRLSPASASQTIVETKSSNSIRNGRENYGERLHNYREQLDKAIASNWVTTTQAADLNSKYEQLTAQEATVRGHEYPKADCDAFDKQMNEFNIQLSDAMAKATKK